MILNTKNSRYIENRVSASAKMLVGNKDVAMATF